MQLIRLGTRRVRWAALIRRAVRAQMLAAEVTVAGLLASSGGGLSEGHAKALLAMFCVFAAGFAWSWVRSPLTEGRIS